MVKATSLASLVTIMELTGVAHKIISETFRTFEVFILAALIYLMINFAMTQLIRLAERRVIPDIETRRQGGAIH